LDEHEDGKKMSPLLLSMPPWLKDLYVSELQEIHRSTRKLEKEVNRLLAKEHYVTEEIPIKTDNMQVIKYPGLRPPKDKEVFVWWQHSNQRPEGSEPDGDNSTTPQPLMRLNMLSVLFIQSFTRFLLDSRMFLANSRNSHLCICT